MNAGNQKITNVAAGTISASSTDAVNGSQLNTTTQNVTTARTQQYSGNECGSSTNYCKHSSHQCCCCPKRQQTKA
ncbi:hypothetical protein IDM32_15880 [Acinetobacter seifertii]|nr:hypothetical protein [Acinetobacter seifertii]